MDGATNYMCLDDFNRLVTGVLDIDLSKPASELAPGLAMEVAPPQAVILSVALKAKAWTGDDFRPLTDEELNSVLVDNPDMTLCGLTKETVTHQAPNGRFFTVRDVLLAVEETERQTRGKSEWFGGIDIHHVFFEGLTEDKGFIRIGWGS